jgi:hypothetical protein
MFLLFITLFVSCMNLYTGVHLPRSDKVQDLGHRTLPMLSDRYANVPHIICASLLALCVFYIQNDPLLTNRFVKTALLLYTLRLISIHLTVLPKLDSRICPKDQPGSMLACSSDYVFSGHTVQTLLCMLFLVHMNPSWTIPMIVVYFVQIFFILGLRYHYTIDVFLGTVLTLLTFKVVK